MAKMRAGGSLFQFISVDCSVVGYLKVKREWLFIKIQQESYRALKFESIHYYLFETKGIFIKKA
jgi:hypothetical protein